MLMNGPSGPATWGWIVAGGRRNQEGSETAVRARIVGMNTIHLTDEELEMAQHALGAYLLAFGHDEADTHKTIRRVLGKLHAAIESEGDEPRATA